MYLSGDDYGGCCDDGYFHDYDCYLSFIIAINVTNCYWSGCDFAHDHYSLKNGCYCEGHCFIFINFINFHFIFTIFI